MQPLERETEEKRQIGSHIEKKAAKAKRDETYKWMKGGKKKERKKKKIETLFSLHLTDFFTHVCMECEIQWCTLIPVNG